MKRGLEWYKRYPQNFLDGIQGLGPELIGAYATILELIYARGGETRRDDHHLSGVMGCSKRKAKALTDALIERGKITVQGEFITNSAARSEAKARRSVAETNANNGQKGGEKSALVRQNKDLTEAVASSEVEPNKSREEKSRAPLTPKGENQPVLFPIPDKPKRKSQFPEDWRPDEKLMAFAASRGFNERLALDLAESCVNHHRAKGNLFLDHGAAYRTWVANERKYRDRDTAQQRGVNQTATSAIGPGFRARLDRIAAGGDR